MTQEDLLALAGQARLHARRHPPHECQAQLQASCMLQLFWEASLPQGEAAFVSWCGPPVAPVPGQCGTAPATRGQKACDSLCSPLSYTAVLLDIPWELSWSGVRPRLCHYCLCNDQACTAVAFSSCQESGLPL